MARKKNAIYDDNFTTVIENEPSVDETEEPTPTPPSTEPIAVLDVYDALAGFVIPTIPMVKESDGSGQCVVCGKHTAYKMRKICADCMMKNGRNYYEKARAAIENGDTVINR